MIQRIQTLHLLAAAVLTAVLLFVPLARYAAGGRTVALHAFALRTTDGEPLAAAAERTPQLVVVAVDGAPTDTDSSAVAAAPAVPAAPEAVGTSASSEVLPPYLGILLAAAAVLPFATIFLYKRRLLQIRLCAVELVLLLGVLVMETIYFFRLKALFADAAATASFAAPQPTAAFPLAALFFVWLASRAIFRDEMLVRAADRIR